MNKAEYRRYLKSGRWRFVRSTRMLLDSGRCSFCFAADGDVDREGRTRHIEIHHRDYRWCGRGSIGGMLREIADTAAYCNVCHQTGHQTNRLGEFLDMTRRPSHKTPVLLLLFVLFVIFGIQYSLFGLLSVVLTWLAVGYALLIVLFFYRA